MVPNNYIYSKGGGYNKWYGNTNLVVYWDGNGKAFLDYIGARVQGVSHYFMSGLTYGEAARGCLSVRVLDKFTIIGSKGPGIFPKKITSLKIHAVLNTRLSSYILRLLSPGLEFSKGIIALFPISKLLNDSPISSTCCDGSRIQTMYKVRTGIAALKALLIRQKLFVSCYFSLYFHILKFHP